MENRRKTTNSLYAWISFARLSAHFDLLHNVRSRMAAFSDDREHHNDNNIIIIMIWLLSIGDYK